MIRASSIIAIKDKEQSPSNGQRSLQRARSVENNCLKR
jgi:hypothetical protein